MEIQLEQLFGLWRYTDANIIIAFYVRLFDERIQRGLSFITMYSISGGAKGINYECQGVPSVVNTTDD